MTRMNVWMLAALAAAVSAAAAARGQCVPTPVGLQQSTATFSQTCDVNNAPGNMIDADPGTGWAIYEGPCGYEEMTYTQTAVLETAADVLNPAPGQPLVLEVSIFSGGFFGSPTSHTLGLFRLSVTGDDRSTFADGLANGGDVGANWVVLTPEALIATVASSTGSTISGAAAVLSVQPDGSILAGGPSPEYTRYVVRAALPLPVMTGLRLEVIDVNGLSGDEALGLPTGGPGRAINGNLLLRELTLGTLPSAGCPGDVNGDCQVSLADLAQLLTHFGTLSGATFADGDSDADGDVDIRDLANLLANSVRLAHRARRHRARRAAPGKLKG